MTDYSKMFNRANGAAFDDAEVAAEYIHRADYPADLYEKVVGLQPGRTRALDLGCGPGKIAIRLAEDFGAVDAIDPSAPMLEAARALGAHRRNIDWRLGMAETASRSGPYDLVTAGASLHWMDHSIVFPRLFDSMSPTGLIAVISVDEAPLDAWDGLWRTFLEDWLRRVGQTPDWPGRKVVGALHEPWMDILGREVITHTVRQSAADFAAAQHARATWTRSRMGADLAAAFDEDLSKRLKPHEKDGLVSFEVTCTLLWGRPRRTIQS
ncbi:MAG: methyltransferase domain-containing protein [Caulobacteraceae bacterium]